MVVTQIWQSLYYGFYLYELAVLKMKICQKSQTCLNITQIFIQGISIHSQALGFSTPCFLKHSPLISFWFYVFSFLTVVAPLFASPFYLTSGSLILKLGTIDIGVR